MSNNIGGVVNIFVFIVAVLGDDVLTLFNHSGSNNNFIFFMTNLLVVTLFLIKDVINNSTFDCFFLFICRHCMNKAR